MERVSVVSVVRILLEAAVTDTHAMNPSASAVRTALFSYSKVSLVLTVPAEAPSIFTSALPMPLILTFTTPVATVTASKRLGAA